MDAKQGMQTRHALRVLIVEDVPTDAELMLRELRKADLEVTSLRVDTRESYETALRKFSPDVVLSDYSLPRFDGLSVLRLTKQLAPSVPVIIVTASIDEETAVDCIKAGAVDYVLKQHPARLGQAVKSALKRREDIEARRRSEEALIRSEERYREFFEEDLSANFLADSEGRILTCNRAFVEVFGFDPRAQAEQSTLVSMFLSEDDWSEFIRELRRKGRLERYEATLRRMDGAEVRVMANFVAKMGEAGGLEQIRGYVIDHTAHHELEAQLRHAQKMEAVGQLAGGVAHDFNNLLTGILGYTEMALDHIGKGHPLYSHLQTIGDAAHRAAALTRQLLAFSRRQVLKPVVLDINGIIQEVDKMLRRLIGENIELITKLGEDIGRIRADPSQIEQVIMNLVVNARDAMPDGGRLLIETANAEIGPEYATRRPGVEPGQYVMVAVSDTGQGMDAATQARIFEPFFTTKEVGKGTGLGLSTVYGIVQQSGGHIWVYSEVGRGTTFKIYLPRVEEAAEEAATQAQDETDTAGTETVLIVEDDELVRELAVSVLRKAGYNVLSAGNGVEALELVSKVDGKIDLVVSDVIMPGISGGGMVERLLAINKDLRVVFMSGYTSRGLLAQSVLPENIPFIQKPFTASTFLRVVRNALDDAGK